jgi:hypothetical protein
MDRMLAGPPRHRAARQCQEAKDPAVSRGASDFPTGAFSAAGLPRPSCHDDAERMRRIEHRSVPLADVTAGHAFRASAFRDTKQEDFLDKTTGASAELLRAAQDASRAVAMPLAMRVAKKTAAKKPAARKAAVKKPAARKAAPKKAAAKRTTTARKPAARKAAPAKKPAARKTVAAKKPAAKKAVAAKKPAARKAAAKPAAKKVVRRPRKTAMPAAPAAPADAAS